MNICTLKKIILVYLLFEVLFGCEIIMIFFQKFFYERSFSYSAWTAHHKNLKRLILTLRFSATELSFFSISCSFCECFYCI
eukprot:maker-scaffold_60-snap-gene-0.49-mRNA-1 protein AED:0.29 eAED:0.29 QI:0/0.5/0.33/1/0/0/3/90/80